MVTNQQPPKWRYLIRGLDGAGDAWAAKGVVVAINIDEAMVQARKETANGLWKDSRGGSCGGPYRITQVSVEIIV